jgi:hypothetical protein
MTTQERLYTVEESAAPDNLPDYTFSGLHGAKAVLNRFQADFIVKWDRRSIITSYVKIDGRQYRVERQDQPGTEILFQNAARLTWWLTDYLANGKPNFAALRYR